MVWFFQWPKGALANSRCPLGQRPRRRVILVEVPAGLVEKDQPVRLLAHTGLTLRAPVLAGLTEVGASLFIGPQRFLSGSSVLPLWKPRRSG